MKQNAKILLTSSEMASLWTAYMNDSKAYWIYKHFLQNTQDTDIRPVIELALQQSSDHLTKLAEFFKAENFDVPAGFSDSDVNLLAPNLFFDPFQLVFIQSSSQMGMMSYGLSLANSSRNDVLTYYSECLRSSIDLFLMATHTLQSKGLLTRAPYYTSEYKVDFVKSQNFITGWFEQKRALSSLEVSNLAFNIQRNEIGRALVMGFSQVANDEKVRKYMLRGRDIAEKHISVFGEILKTSHLPTAMSWDMLPNDSTTPPFSEKLMMFHITELNAIGISNYGIALSTSARKDIQMAYIRLTAEIADYAEEGAKILIDKGWMEQPPLASDREKLATR